MDSELKFRLICPHCGAETPFRRRPQDPAWAASLTQPCAKSTCIQDDRFIPEYRDRFGVQRHV